MNTRTFTHELVRQDGHVLGSIVLNNTLASRVRVELGRKKTVRKRGGGRRRQVDHLVYWRLPVTQTTIGQGAFLHTRIGVHTQEPSFEALVIIGDGDEEKVQVRKLH